MPPRKRAASAPKPDPEETTEPVAEDDGDETTAEAVTAEPQDSDGDTEAKPERSDIQMVDVPCPTCFPDGWGGPAVGARGCEHGTWQREAAD